MAVVSSKLTSKLVKSMSVHDKNKVKGLCLQSCGHAIIDDQYILFNFPLL